MYDFNSKILTNQSRAIELAKASSRVGFRDILVTPEFAYQENLASTYEDNYEQYLEMSKKLKKNNIDLEIYLGNQIQYTDEVIELLKDAKIRTINHTKYILLAFDKIESNFYSMIEAVFQLQIKGYRPIISQIEQYQCVIHNSTIVEDIHDRDILTQLDILSITGEYGDAIKKTAKTLLENNQIHTLGTNINEPKDYKKISKALKKIKRIVGKTKFEELTTTNAQHIIDDKELKFSYSRASC